MAMIRGESKHLTTLHALNLSKILITCVKKLNIDKLMQIWTHWTAWKACHKLNHTALVGIFAKWKRDFRLVERKVLPISYRTRSAERALVQVLLRTTHSKKSVPLVSPPNLLRPGVVITRKRLCLTLSDSSIPEGKLIIHDVPLHDHIIP